MSKAIIAADATGVTKTDTTIIDNVLGGVTSILKVASTEDANTTYYSDKAVGQAVLAGMVGGFMIGDRFGDKVPFLGGRRN